MSEPMTPEAITPLDCTDEGCRWAVHGIPDRYVGARWFTLARHRAEEHGEPLTPEQVAYAQTHGHALPDAGKDTATGGESTRAEQPLAAEQEQEIRAEVLGEFTAWLVKKAREERAKGPRFTREADAIGVLASKVSRGAIRPNNLATLERQGDGGPEDVPALLAELDRLKQAAADARYYLAAFVYDSEDPGTGALGALHLLGAAGVPAGRGDLSEQVMARHVAAAVDAAQDAEIDRLRAELEARPSRAETLRKVADKWAAHCPEHSDADGVWMDCPAEWVYELRCEADAAETGRCCHLHKVDCCDPEDCGPCCMKCPTCPTLIRQRNAEAGEGSAAPESYPPALPWAALMDDEDLADFLDELAAEAGVRRAPQAALAEVERVCSEHRLIAEAQHAHNTAAGPDAQAGEGEPRTPRRDETHTNCGMPLNRRLDCGHCPHEICQDCDRCPCSCGCAAMREADRA